MDTKYFGKEPPLVDLADFPSWIIYEDENWLALNKPGWLVCHPSKNGPLSSLVGAAREYSGCDELHLISRLDRETSGVVMLAKNKKTASAAQKALEDRSVGKDYLAILEGEFLGTAVIAQPLVEDAASLVAIKQCCCARKGSAKHSVSVFKSLRPQSSSSAYSLAKVELITGRKHQIRAHAQWFGHPVAGDKIYGPDETLYLDFIEGGFTDEMAKVLPLPRQALHAWRVDFSKIFPGVVFTAPLTQDLVEFSEQNRIDLSALENL